MGDEANELVPAGQPGDATDVASAVVLSQQGLVVLQGSSDIVERLIENDFALARTKPTETSRPVASGALAHLGDLAELVGSSGTTQQVFQLDQAGMDMFNNGELASAGDGLMRAFGQGADGKITGHAALQQVDFNPQQLLSAQMAMTTVALTAAIKEVQDAVERVEDKVDYLKDLLDSERVGQVLGIHKALARRAEHIGFDGSLGDADWHAIDGVGVQVEQQIEALRSFVRKRLTSAEQQGRDISDRRDALDDVRELSEALALLIVAQDNLFLFQQLRLTRIRDTEPHRLENAMAEAHTLLAGHKDDDERMVQRARQVVADRVTVRALEIHRHLSARAVVRTSADVDEMLDWFAEERSLQYDTISIPPIPGVSEAVTELRGHGGRALAGGSGAAKGVSRWVNDGVRSTISRGRNVDNADAAEASAELQTSPPGEVESPRSSEGDEAPGSRLARVRRLRPRRSTGRDEADDPAEGDDG